MPAAPDLPVLMYHSIADEAPAAIRDLVVSPARLRDQLTALGHAGYALVGLTEALRRRARDPRVRVVALTFDDGFRDFLTAALPVLAHCGANATLYQSVGHIGRSANWLGDAAPVVGPLLTWAELAEVSAAGIEIGNHSLVHHPLDVLPLRQVAGEVRTAADRLRQRLGVPVRSFAYPHGYHSRAVRAIVAAAGHDTACEVGRRLATPEGNRLAIARLQATDEHSGADMVHLVSVGEPRLEATAKRAATPAWRAVRRIAYRGLGHRLT